MMGDVEDMLGELEDEAAAVAKRTVKKRPRSQDDLELDLDKAWMGAARSDE